MPIRVDITSWSDASTPETSLYDPLILADSMIWVGSSSAAGAGSVTTTTYRLRAWDSGTDGWVFWSATSTATPTLSVDTNPDFTGTLSKIAIIGKKVT
jgi:hypothetical protein